MRRTPSSKRALRNSGKVVKAPARYLGKKKNAMSTVATAAVTSQPMLLRL